MPDKQPIPETGWIETRQTRIEAMVRYNNSGFHRHTLRDVSTHGAFIEMGNVRVLRQSTPVKIVFVHHEHGINNTHQIDAEVTAVEARGVRLKFANVDAPACQALKSFE